MNDRYYLENNLLLLKSTVEVYIHGTLESVNQKARSLLQQNLLDTIEMQKETYDKMTNKGWYTIENCKKECITKTLNKIKKEDN